MTTAPIIAFRGVGRSTALEANIRSHVQKLETYCDSIIACRVLVERAERRHTAGNRFRVRIALAVPGEELVVTAGGRQHPAATEDPAIRKAGEAHPERKDAYVAVHQAFDAATERLRRIGRWRRRPVRSRRPAQARLAELAAASQRRGQTGSEPINRTTVEGGRL